MMRVISISLTAAGTPCNAGDLRSGGISSKRSSMLRTPIASSMVRISASVCGMNGILGKLLAGRHCPTGSESAGFGLEVSGVRSRVHQCADVGGAFWAQTHQPARTVWVLVDELRSVRKRAIAFGHLAADRRVDIRSSLH